jgi:hypothetical protein
MVDSTSHVDEAIVEAHEEPKSYTETRCKQAAADCTEECEEQPVMAMIPVVEWLRWVPPILCL